MATNIKSPLRTITLIIIANLFLTNELLEEGNFPNVTLNNIIDRDVIKLNIDKHKRSTNVSESNVIDDMEYMLLNSSDREKKDLTVNETETERLLDAIEDTTEFGDNSTRKTCVGDPEYCDMTEDQYMDLLNEYIFPQTYEWVLIAVHAIVFTIGLIGNALVCVAVYRNHSMRTVTNYFIVNLAVADFMVILICLPPTVLWDVTKTWFFGTAMCKIVLYFQSVSVTVSVLTLTFISVDRWYAICFPLKFKSTTGRAKTAILIIWLISLLFNVPEFVVLQVQRKMQLRFNVEYFMQCTSTWSDESDLNWHIIKAIFLYTFPLLLMTIAYCQIVRVLWRSDNIPGHAESHKLCNTTGQSNNWLAASRRTTPSIHTNASTEGQLRSRRKAAKMIVAVVAMFAVCYFPVHLLSVLRVAYDVQQSDVMTCIALISHVMCYANSAVNPLIYNFMSGKFRREFHRSYFKCFCCCHSSQAPEQNGTSFAPIGSSRAGTTRTIVRRNDSCVSYRLTHLSPSNHNIHRDYIRNTNTSFIEHLNGNRRPKREDSISESTTRFTLATDVARE